MSADNEFLVTCSVCLCDYDGESRKQKYLPCLHSFCQSCLTQVKQFDRIKCPICRCEVRVLSGDVSTLPDTYFECLREMENKIKEIQPKEMEKARRIEEMKQEKEEMKREKEKMKQEQEEMKRKIAQQGGKINQLRWSNNRLASDCDELQQVNQHMETVVVAKDKQICSLKKLVSAKKLEGAQNQKRPDEAQAARNEDIYFPDPEDILQLRDEDDEDEEHALIDLLYPVDPSDSNEEWIDHQDYIEESNEEACEEESRCMEAFEDDCCDAIADHLEFLNM